MKKIVALLVFVMMIASAFAVSADAVPTDTFQNELYDVVAPIIDVPASEASSHGKVIYSEIENYPEKILTRIYADGARIRYAFTGEDFEHVSIEFADEGYPAFLTEEADNKFLLTEEGYAETQTVRWYYLATVNGENVTKDLICVETMDTALERGIKIEYVSKDANGTEVYTLAQGCPMTYDEYYALAYPEAYNDGLILKRGNEGTGYYDASGKALFVDPQIGYYVYGHNLGYLFEVTNNGGELDWGSGEDVEYQRRFTTQITNIRTGASYEFGNTKLETIFDNGYGIMSVKDDKGDDLDFLVKLKKPAIITVYLDGKKIAFDQVPVIQNERTLVPLRAIFEAMGASVEWDASTRTVTAVKGDTTVKLTVDSTAAYKNGQEITLDAPARIIGGRTLVPVRFIADCFDVNTEWVKELTKVELTTK